MSYGSVNYGSAKSSSSAAEPPQPCPEDCSECDTNIPATVTFPGCDNITWDEITLVNDGGDGGGNCHYYFYGHIYVNGNVDGDVGLTVDCIDGYWVADLTLAVWGLEAGGPDCNSGHWTGELANRDNCPRTGSYPMSEEDDSDCNCADTPTVTL